MGHVIHLSQHLGSLAGPFLSRRCVSGLTSEVEICGDGTEKESSSERNDVRLVGLKKTGVDAVTMLLSLGGYMLLVRIYSTGMGHFQMHLSSISSGSNGTIHNHVASSARTNINLQLGELPYAAPVLGRIHTVVCMLLLPELHGVEDQSEQRGAVARILAQDVLGADELQGNYHGLSIKISSVKKVLEEELLLQIK